MLILYPRATSNTLSPYRKFTSMNILVIFPVPDNVAAREEHLNSLMLLFRSQVGNNSTVNVANVSGLTGLTAHYTLGFTKTTYGPRTEPPGSSYGIQHLNLNNYSFVHDLSPLGHKKETGTKQ